MPIEMGIVSEVRLRPQLGLSKICPLLHELYKRCLVFLSNTLPYIENILSTFECSWGYELATFR